MRYKRVWRRWWQRWQLKFLYLYKYPHDYRAIEIIQENLKINEQPLQYNQIIKYNLKLQIISGRENHQLPKNIYICI